MFIMNTAVFQAVLADTRIDKRLYIPANRCLACFRYKAKTENEGTGKHVCRKKGVVGEMLNLLESRPPSSSP
jgi:hypothetical protein